MISRALLWIRTRALRGALQKPLCVCAKVCLGLFGFVGLFSHAAAQVPVSGMVQVSGGYLYTCGVDGNGAVSCWGYSGVLGIGSSGDQAYPIATAITSGATKVSAGTYHACAVVAGAARCWGAGTLGELGDGNGNNSTLPVTPTGLSSGVTDVAAGTFNSCAVVNGAAMCVRDRQRWCQVLGHRHLGTTG